MHLPPHTRSAVSRSRADAFVKYTANVSKLETAWGALEDIATALLMPASFTAAMNKAGIGRYLGISRRGERRSQRADDQAQDAQV